jgi:hypothetical protein
MYLSPNAHRIKYFTIFGERCSGTHFLQHAILTNFHIQYVKGEKHFFGNKEFRDTAKNAGLVEAGVRGITGEDLSSKGILDITQQPNNLTLFEQKMFEFDSIDTEELLVFAIVRDPVEWMDSFYKRCHHVPPENRRPYERFVSCEFYSIYEDGPKNKQEIMEDRHWKTKERYRNIFELRDWKNRYMMEELPKQYVHYYLLKYEDLRDNYAETLEHIRKRFGLRKKPETYIPILKQKGTYNALYEKKPILLTDTQQQEIWSNINVNQENALGFFMAQK